MTTRSRPRIAPPLAIGVLAIATASALAIPAATAAGSPKWGTVSKTNLKTTLTTPSIAKFGSSYEVVWVAFTGSAYNLDARILNAAGKAQGGVITAVKGWSELNGDPTILADGSTRIIAFSGDKSVSASPYNSGAEYDVTSSNGKNWTLNTGSLSAADGADRANGVSVINDGGTIDTGMVVNGRVAYHFGTSGSNPAPGSDLETATTGNGTQLPGLGADAKSGVIWAVWWSDSSGKDEGVHAQQISPGLGSLLNGPGSTSKTFGSYGGVQDASVASRSGGGVYTAYSNPTRKAIEIWKLGSTKAMTVKDPTGIDTVVLTSAPHGRLWLYWNNANGWRATRSNKAATRFGPVTKVAIPKNAIINLHLAGYGAAGPLEAIGTDTPTSNANTVIATQILPKLRVSASRHTVKRKHSITFTVTDAGDPVKGATVKFDGAKKKTNAKGVAKFKVAKSSSLGTHNVTVGDGGYAGAGTSVKVTK